MSCIVVGVPTFRRPVFLERCLRSLSEQDISQSFWVIVGDNDANERGGVAVCERLKAEGFRLDVTPITVEQRGIAPTRNALVAEALKNPATTFIAMIDDDEWAAPQWLSELLRVQAAYDAHVVGGPVQRIFESPVPEYVKEITRRNATKRPTGPIDLVDATSNILFDAELFRSRPAPWFDLQYAMMGCEDKDILLSFKLRGRRFAWAADAVVTEELPSSRCSLKWMLQRSYRVGNTDTIVNLKHRPPGFSAVSEFAKITGALGIALFNLTIFAWHAERRFEGARLGARVLGKLVAFFGGRHEEYKVIHGR